MQRLERMPALPSQHAAKVAAVRAKAKSAIAEAKKQQADEPLDMFA